MKYLVSGMTALANALDPLCRPFYEAMEESRKKKANEAKEFARHFRFEITKGFWGTRTKAIQRDEPLTDEQLSKLGF